jgi:predicted CXXCH cytochrome family protein
MRGSKNQNLGLFRYGPLSVGFALLVFFVLSVGSCDKVEHHKVMSYFFDGVPPLEQGRFEAGLFDPNTQQLDQTGQTQAWYVHEPRRDCTNCHPKKRSSGFSAQTYLIAPVPKLCHNCHADYTSTASFVHGPVAVGQCLFCHFPHKSKIEHLLIEPEPELCYLCHDASMIELIPAHLPEQTSACTDCHDPHAASTKALLKDPSIKTKDKQEKSLNQPTPIGRAATPHQSQQLSQRQRETAELYYRSMQLYRDGELTRARNGFVNVLESGLIPAPMANTLRAHIADIDNRLTRTQIRPNNKPKSAH